MKVAQILEIAKQMGKFSFETPEAWGVAFAKAIAAAQRVECAEIYVHYLGSDAISDAIRKGGE